MDRFATERNERAEGWMKGRRRSERRGDACTTRCEQRDGEVVNEAVGGGTGNEGNANALEPRMSRRQWHNVSCAGEVPVDGSGR